jgi:chaperone required for assembly of F1-ATPase
MAEAKSIPAGAEAGRNRPGRREPGPGSAGARPRRFYTEARAAPVEGGHGVVLDDRPVLTPLGRPLRVAHQVLGAAIAAEWAAQQSHIDTGAMPLTRIASTAIDHVGRERAGVVAVIARYAACDLVCYRAGAPAGLALRQAEAWDPIVAWAEAAAGARVALATGIVAVEQPARMLDALGAHIAAHDDLALTALAMTTTMTGSALIALALSHGLMGADAAWAAAHVDEDWQIARWGEDAEAARVRARLHRDFAAAARVLGICRA